MRPIQLSKKEIDRSCEGITVVVRPQLDGSYMVATVSLKTCLPIINKPEFVLKEEISKTVKYQVRWLDKVGGIGGDMSDASRTRNFLTPQKE